MLKFVAISGISGITASLMYFAQSTDPLSGGGGWFGAGLLGLILAWLLLRHLPDKDRQLAEFMREKDAHIKAITEEYKGVIKALTEEYKTGIKMLTEQSQHEIRIDRAATEAKYRDVTAILMTIHNSTRECIHAIKNLHQSVTLKQVLADAFQSTEVPAWTKHLDGTLTSWNGAAEHMFGWKQGEVVGRSVYDHIIPPERREEEQDVLNRIAKGETVEAYNTERMSKSGRRIPIRVVTSPIRNQNGLVIGASSLSRPVTNDDDGH